jgi:hypothetical protein
MILPELVLNSSEVNSIPLRRASLHRPVETLAALLAPPFRWVDRRGVDAHGGDLRPLDRVGRRSKRSDLEEVLEVLLQAGVGTGHHVPQVLDATV